MDKITKLPWKILPSLNRMPDGSVSRNLFLVLDANNNMVIDYISRDNLDFLERSVLAVNSRDGLVEALKAIRLRSNDSSNGFLEAIYNIAEEALKVADGEGV